MVSCAFSFYFSACFDCDSVYHFVVACLIFNEREEERERVGMTWVGEEALGGVVCVKT